MNGAGSLAGMLTQPAVAVAGSLAELKLRICYHRWGGVMGWMEFKISKLGHGLGLGLS